MANYAEKHWLSNSLLVMFIISWIATRLTYFPLWVIRSCLHEPIEVCQSCYSCKVSDTCTSRKEQWSMFIFTQMRLCACRIVSFCLWKHLLQVCSMLYTDESSWAHAIAVHNREWSRLHCKLLSWSCWRSQPSIHLRRLTVCANLSSHKAITKCLQGSSRLGGVCDVPVQETIHMPGSFWQHCRSAQQQSIKEHDLPEASALMLQTYKPEFTHL